VKPTDLLLQPLRAEVAVAHDPFGIAAGTAARFRAAGNDEIRLCDAALSRKRANERERVE
jgi:hypothetical protein